ncbi:MAG: UDP-N-acetylglucosamine 2-epimerase (non-hydrolyzing) [Deltaproteobacteria bacterium]|nr:UDP-N-acetylglucosamine 2-epimerase (non-hydrolyzing) [Deltaproteobacteria bacterium]
MDSNRLTLLTIFGTRPEVIKLFPVLKEINEDQRFNSIVVSTAQHREMIQDFLSLFDISLDHDLDIMRKNQSLVDISRRALTGLDPLLKEHRPDLVLVQGDTTTAFIGALAAFYNKISAGHIEAGLRSFNKQHPYPEEVNRRLISNVCDLHFAPTLRNANNLYKEGIGTAGVFVTGNTVIDTLLYVANRNRETLGKYLPMEVLNSHRMILVTAHRRENWGESLENLCYALRDLARAYADIQIVYPVHLNPNVRKTAFAVLSNQERIHLVDPLPYEPFVEAMAKSYFIITDSGGIQEEGPSLQKPVFVFRKVTERPEGLGTGGVKLVGLEKESVLREASRLLEDPAAYQEMVAEHNPYGDGKAAQRIVKAILHHFGQGDRPQDFAAPKHERT